MVADAFSQLVESALSDFQRYLQDEIPPAEVAKSVATLMDQTPGVLMQLVNTWAAERNRTERIPLSDLLFHALQKVFITGEVGLLDREEVANYLDRMMGLAIRACPAEARGGLRSNLTDMRVSRNLAPIVPPPEGGSGQASPRHAPTPAFLGHTPPSPHAVRTPAPSFSGPTPSPAFPGHVEVPTFSGQTPVPTEDAQLARRFSLIVDRLKRHTGSAASSAPAAQPDSQALAQLLTMAASRSQSGDQLNGYLDQIRPLAGAAGGNVFVILGGAMPSWDLPDLAPGGHRPPPAQVEAMEKILELADDPVVAMQHFRDLVDAAVQKFNEGSLAATVWMLDVAHESIAEKRLDLATVDRIRAEAASALGTAQLRRYAETKNKQSALRLVLEFFPTLRLESLFEGLRSEAQAEGRHVLLSLIEAHGDGARRLALDELERELGRPDLDTYYARNLIFLLHRIPRHAGHDGGRELDALARASERGQNIYVIKEAATAIGMLQTEDAVRLLTMRLAEFESLLLRNDPHYPEAEMQKLLDRLISALARIGTASALLTIARHGMQANARLGDTRARLSVLAQHDLSFDDATVSVLLTALRDEIPGRLLGPQALPERHDSTVRLIEALSGTRSDAVEELFRELVLRFPEEDAGQAAARALETYGPARGASAPPTGGTATLTGELEFFGLPALMQSLAEMRATGMLTLRSPQGDAAAKLALLDGMFLNAQRGHVRGPDAVYEMLERPITGSFAFVPMPEEKMQSGFEPRDILGLLLEGVRRHDELQRILALVPDELTLTRTNVKPTPHEEEKDPSLVRDVWMKLATGAPIGQWERELGTDTYRVRRLIAHWLEQGTLVAR